MKTISIIVNGRVQGVYFRQSIKDKAMELEITGRVRNEADGSVKITACGEDEQLQKLIKWCHKGPSGARVDGVQVEELSMEHYNDFRIERNF